MIDVCSFRFENRDVSFAVQNRHDVIQARHSSGCFYEIEQLIAHRNLIWSGSNVLDIGSNVGNHTIFYALFSKATKVFPFEPNSTARNLLLQSVQLNGLQNKIGLEWADCAVGQASGEALIGPEPENNLGATWMIEKSAGASVAEGQRVVRCVAIDDLQISFRTSLVKLDVEGWEIAVLKGAKKFIADQRPFFAIEVNINNEHDFWVWVEENLYSPIGCYQDTGSCKTYVLIPRA